MHTYRCIHARNAYVLVRTSDLIALQVQHQKKTFEVKDLKLTSIILAIIYPPLK